MRRDRTIVNTSVLVGRVIQHYNLGEQMGQVNVIDNWADLVGARIGQRSRAAAIVDRVLIVEVASSAWLAELKMMGPALRTSILERLLPARPFDDIRLVLARDRNPNPPRPRARTLPAPPPPPVPASGDAVIRIVRETAVVEDDALREIIRRVRLAHDR